jgi:hypothetical protein
MTEAPARSSLQSLAASQPGGGGAGRDWQSIAAANGIENPRLLQPGQLIDLNPPSIGLSASAGVSADVGASAGAQIG